MANFFFNMNYLTTPNLGGTNLGGGFQGVSASQRTNGYRDYEDTRIRTTLVKSWNTAYATGTVNGRSRVITPFRAVNNSGDYLARHDYVCGGPNPTNATRPGYGIRIRNIPSQCDGTGIPASSCNVRWVADSSDYVTFKKQQAMNRNFNKYKFGGDQHNASQVPLKRSHL